jgi:putative phage-type endonuclease
MSVEILKFSNREDWLELRANDVTATEVSALFGVSPYMSKYQLWHQKKTKTVEGVEETERMKWGTRLEDAIAKGIREDLGLGGSKVDRYYRDTVLKAGASPDWQLLDNDGDVHVLEIKNVDGFAFKRGWKILDDGEVVAPLHIELQLQQQMMLMNCRSGVIGALVGGNNVQILRREANGELIDAIKKKIQNFWASIEANEPPEINFEDDYDLIMDLSRESDKGEPINASLRVCELIAEYNNLKTVADKADKKIKAIKAEILHEVGDHALVHGDGWKLDTKLIGGSDGKAITADMVGTITGIRKPYRQFRIIGA